MKISDRMYRDLRKIVTSSTIGDKAKKLLLVGLRSYYSGRSIPCKMRLYRGNRRRCIVGAAMHEVGTRNEYTTMDHFGIDRKLVFHFTGGFDHGDNTTNISRVTARLSKKIFRRK
jgi:hypothetical protein